MSVGWIDIDGPAVHTPTDTGVSPEETWVAIRPPLTTTELPWEEDADGPGRVRRQYVFIPTLNAWDAVRAAQTAMEAGAPHVIRLFPGPLGHRFPLVEWTLDPLPALCEREGYALALDYGPRGSLPLADLAAFARACPEVAILLMGDRLSDQPAVGRLLDRCPNVLLQLTRRVSPDDLRAMVTTFGSHRFVYGTRGAVPTAGDGTVKDLEPGDRDAVISGNARLLDACKWRDQYL